MPPGRTLQDANSMLSRLLTRKEQAILAGLAVALFTGAVVLATHSPTHSGASVLPIENVPVVTLSPSTASPPMPSAVYEAPASAPVEKHMAIGIVGAVARPGLYRLSNGARVADLVAIAGGTTPGAETGDINLAALLLDGTTLEIPTRTSEARFNPPQYTISGTRRLSIAPTDRVAMQTVASVSPRTMPVQGPASYGLINLNTATQAQLETLPGIGPATALKIIEYRRMRPFARVDDLLEVSGIGPVKLEELRRLVCVR